MKTIQNLVCLGLLRCKNLTTFLGWRESRSLNKTRGGYVPLPKKNPFPKLPPLASWAITEITFLVTGLLGPMPLGDPASGPCQRWTSVNFSDVHKGSISWFGRLVSINGYGSKWSKLGCFTSQDSLLLLVALLPNIHAGQCHPATSCFQRISEISTIHQRSC